MKKSITIIVMGCLLAACGGKQEKKDTAPAETKTEISEEEAKEVIELDQASDEIIEKTEELNQQLDSLIKEI